MIVTRTGKISSIYLRSADLRLIARLKERLGLDRSEILRLALRVLCMREGVDVQ
jgi:hypothetical protein